MNFFRVKRFGLSHKLKVQGADPKNNQMCAVEELKVESTESAQKVDAADESAEEAENDDDDDFVSNDVKRRFTEMRKNSFMVLIPEESNLEEEEETSSSEWRESELEDGYPLSDFDTLYIRYCERMMFFDKLIVQNMKEAGIR